MNIAPINLISFKNSSSLNKNDLYLDVDDKISKKYPIINMENKKNMLFIEPDLKLKENVAENDISKTQYEYGLCSKDPFACFSQRRDEIFSKMQKIRKKIDETKNNTNAQIQSKRDCQQAVRSAANRAIATLDNKIFQIETESKKQISALKFELLLLEQELISLEKEHKSSLKNPLI